MRSHAAKTVESWTTSHCSNLTRVFAGTTRPERCYPGKQYVYLNNPRPRSATTPLVKKNKWGKRPCDRIEPKFLTPQLMYLCNGKFELLYFPELHWDDEKFWRLHIVVSYARENRMLLKLWKARSLLKLWQSDERDCCHDQTLLLFCLKTIRCVNNMSPQQCHR